MSGCSAPASSAQQRGLAGAVESQHDHPRAAVDGQVDAGEHFQRSVGLAQPLGHQRCAPARGRGGELDPGHLVGDPFLVECGHHPVGATQHILRRNGFGGLGAELGGLRAQRGGLAFGVGAFAAATLLVGGPGVEVLLPAHVVDVDFAAHGVQEPHPIDDVGEQVDVVADDYQPAGVCPQEIPQPAKRIRVQVVGRFVEQQRGV